MWDPGKYDLYQLLGYAALNEIGYKRVSNKITVINLVKGFYYTCDITSWLTQDKNEYINFIGETKHINKTTIENPFDKKWSSKSMKRLIEETDDPKLKARLVKLKKQLY